MKQKLFCITFIFLLAASCLLPEATAQPRVPKIGYLYPAGGQQGTTFLVLVGGRDITRSSEIIVSGNGVSGRVVRDTLALHINDANERRLIHQLYWEALATLQGEASLPPRPPTPAQSADNTPLPTVEEVMNKYPYIELLQNLTPSNLELVYYYYFSPRINRNPLPETLNRGVLLEMTIAPDAEPGDRDFRLLGPAGLTPPARFMVGIYPEVREQEPNNTLSEDPESRNYRWREAALAPQSLRNQPPLELPVVINGQIHTGDVDHFPFTAKQGQKLVIDVRARHLRPYLADAVPGWFQAAIVLFDSDGKRMEEAMSYLYEPDPVLLFDVPKEGVYTLAIQDSIFRGRDDFVYRITIAESPWVTSVFPLGGQREHLHGFNLNGWNLQQNIMFLGERRNEKGVHEVSYISRTERPSLIPLTIHTWLPRPIYVAIDNLPETIESEPNDDFNRAENLQHPIIINGRISNKNDVDVFAFEGRKGERVVLDVTARSLGSPLDAMLELFDADKTLIASNDDRANSTGPNIGLQTHHADPYLNVELPADGRYFIRLYDVTQQGGEAFVYRLRISPPQPDFSVFCEPSSLTLRGTTPQLMKVRVVRKEGFDGGIRLRLANVNVFQLNDDMIAADTNEAAIRISALPRYLGATREVALEAVATIDGKEVVRPVTAVDNMEQAFIYHHWVSAKSLVISRPRPAIQPGNAGGIPAR